MSQTVIDYVLSRLKQLGIKDVFGVPGDYSFGISDAICTDRDLRWIGCSNELNAAMAQAETCGTGAYIEVMTDKMAASPLALKLHEAVQTLYGNK